MGKQGGTDDNNGGREEKKVGKWGGMIGVDCNSRLSYNLKIRLGERSALQVQVGLPFCVR